MSTDAMRNGSLIFFVLFLIATPLAAENLGVLDGVLRPSTISIAGDRLFIMDVEQMHIFSLENREHLATFGKKGEGPGEYQVAFGLPNRMEAYPDFLLMESINKILFYDHQGRFVKEQKKLPLLGMIRPLNGKFVARRIYQPQDGSKSYTTVRIYDENLEMEKELARQDFMQQGAGLNLTFDLSNDFLIFGVAEGKIFIEKSTEGPIIEVYDANGEILDRIRFPARKIPVTAAEKKKMLQNFRNDPRIRQVTKANNTTWEAISQNFRFRYPDEYPPVNHMYLDGGRIYIRTNYREEGRFEYLILDLQGRLLRRTFVDPTIPPQLMSQLMGIQRETIYRGKIYYLTENKDGDWELNVLPI